MSGRKKNVQMSKIQNAASGLKKDAVLSTNKKKSHPFDGIIQTSSESKARQATSYQLLLVKENEDGSYSLYDESGKKAEVEYTLTEYPYLYRVAIKDPEQNNVFEFPITPQVMNINTPYSIETLAASNGVIEEHAGVYFKHITLSGTFGVNPGRKSFAASAMNRPADNSFKGLISTLFSNTIDRARELKSQLNKLTKSLPFGLDKRFNKNANKQQSVPAKDVGTGYYYALALDRFLENYAIKKSQSSANKKIKLALHLPKFGYAYLVTPVSYTYNQSADSPLEYKFTLQLKAYKRIALKAKSVINNANKIVRRELNDFQKIFVSLNRARMALSVSYDTVRAARNDALTPFEVLRSAIIVTKGALSLPFTAADVYVDISNAINFIKNSDSPGLRFVLSKYGKFFNSIMGGSGSRTGNNMGGYLMIAPNNDNGGTNGNDNVPNDIESPYQISEILDLFNIEDYPMTDAESEQFTSELESLSEITSDKVDEWIKALRETAYLLADYFGAGDATVSKIYNKPLPKQRLQDMSIDESLLLSNLYEAITALYLLKSSNLIVKNDNKAFEIVGELTENTSYEFGSGPNNLAIKVPVPYGLTIEQIAQKYLGDYRRWVEIATLNNLNSPYIDEEGFVRPFLSNGSGRNFNIADGSNLYVGQKIFLMSDTVPKTMRTILAINKLSDTDYLITVDGLDNLHIFKTSENARMHAFLPHTTNSTQTIWIPVQETTDDLAVFSPPEVAKLDKYTGISKVDWMLGDDGDVAIDNFGDIKLSYGLKNLYQSLRLKIISPQGSRLVDPDYGMGITPGINLGDISLDDMIKKFHYMIKADERFGEIESLEIDLRGPVMKINAIVALRDGSGSVPISVAINET